MFCNRLVLTWNIKKRPSIRYGWAKTSVERAVLREVIRLGETLRVAGRVCRRAERDWRLFLD